MANLKLVSSSVGGDPYASERITFETDGDSITGHLVDSVTLSKDGSSFKKYTIKTSDGNYMSTLGSHQLDQALGKVPAGSLVQITFKGRKKIKGGKTVKEFEVMNDPNDIDADESSTLSSARA